MMRYVFMCRSLTYAQSAARVLEKNAISASVKKAPTGLSGSGCSYSVSVSYIKGTAAAGVLRREGLLQGKVFLRHDDGSHTEVIL
ncbi:MAG: hypothetical protein BHW36_03215 [Firmicutes bacterium CAG:24053_14]|nr:MAG: hypothetical protein BHW36_03215 [Firmicutes bacterium CAG:24053_14]